MKEPVLGDRLAQGRRRSGGEHQIGTVRTGGGKHRDEGEKDAEKQKRRVIDMVDPSKVGRWRAQFAHDHDRDARHAVPYVE